MPKQTLQQKIRRALGRFTAKRIAMILLGAAILSFGIHNIHQRTAITEGGVIGLVLLINHWLGVPASVASPLLDAASYALAFKFLGWDFLLSAGVASVSLAGFYRIWECLPPMLPDLTPWRRRCWAACSSASAWGSSCGRAGPAAATTPSPLSSIR